MTFLHPEFLYYMLPVLIVLFAFILTQKESQEDFFSKEIIDKLRVSENSMTLRARNALFFLVGFLMILALAQPVLKDGKIEVKAKSSDIIIALDISDSMLAEDVYPNRLAHAKQKALTLLSDAPNERIGVVAFAKNSYLVSPLSFDIPSVSFLLSKLDTSSITQKGTDFVTMLRTVAKTDAKTDKKYLLVLSDGGDEDEFSEAINLAKEEGIVVFVLGVGTSSGAPIKLQDGSFIKYKDKVVISKLNENISDLATSTGGVYIQSITSNDDIKTMLSEIIDSSEKKELRSQQVQKYIALFYYPIILAMFILLIAFSSIGKRIRHNMPASVFLLFVILSSQIELSASVFDFMKLGDAKKSYEAGDYNSSAIIYENFAKQGNNPEAYYNAGNAYYKNENYLKAIESYTKARFDDENQSADNLSNMANAYVKLGTKNTLEKAVPLYENSLKIREDRVTRENLEAVKKVLEEMEEKKDQQDSSDSQDQDQDKKERSGDEDGGDSDEQEPQNKKEQDKDKKDNKNSAGDNQDSNDNKEAKNEDSKADNEDGTNSQDGDKNQEEISEDEKKAKELSDKNNQQNSDEAKQLEQNAQIMSDIEEEKWLDHLNTKQTTYLYRLNKQEKEQREQNEKPW